MMDQRIPEGTMPIFSRKGKEEALVEKIVSELQKANNLANTPMAASAQYATSTAAQPSQMSGGQGLLQTPGSFATPLPRPAGAFGSQLGPAAPFLPAPLDPVDPSTGRALPRKWEYPVAWNLDLNQRSAPWSILRALTDQCDIVHRCIEIRISELVKQGWTWTLSDQAVNEIMAEEDCSHAKAQKIGRERYQEELNRLREFWDNPYPELGRGWNEWLTEFLWQHFAFDGVPVYPRYNLGKRIIGFEIIDAPTIKVLLDNRGGMPQPPAPAFQQVLWGFPRGEYQTSPSSDGEFYSGPGVGQEYLLDQISYHVRNRRTWSPYGFSHVEEAIPAATLYLQRQAWMNSEYAEGSMPLTFMRTDVTSDIEPLKLQSFERILNDTLAGSTAERHRIKVLPGGFDPVAMPQIEQRYSEIYDEFLIKRIASIFGVAPSQVGVVPRAGLGGKGEHDGEMDQAETVSQKPMEEFIVEVVNTLSRRFLGAGKHLTFALVDGSSARTDETVAKAYQIAINSGMKTLNDVRGEIGEPVFEMPEADEPFIMTANGPVFLKGLLATTSSGETIGQVGGSNGSREEQSGQHQGERGEPLGQHQDHQSLGEPKPQEGPSQEEEGPIRNQDKGEPGISQESKAAGLELAVFEKFARSRMKSGSFREFEFEVIDEETAQCLNADLEVIIKGDGFSPPQGVREAASRALEWIKDGKAGGGFTDVGRKRASDLSRGASVSLETLKRMKAYFDRHQSDKNAEGFSSGEEGYPSPGRVAWDAWGGDAGYSWAKKIVAQQEKAVQPGDNPLAFYRVL